MADINTQIDGSGVLGALSRLSQGAAQAFRGDRTVSGEVVKIKNASTGEYLISFQDATFSAFATSPTVTYSVGDTVYVLVPEGHLSQKKLILGMASAADNLTYAEMQELTNFYIPQGPNWLDDTYYGIDHKDMGICSAPRTAKAALSNAKGANYTDYCFARWPYLGQEGGPQQFNITRRDAAGNLVTTTHTEKASPYNDPKYAKYWGNCARQPYAVEYPAHYDAADRDPVSYPSPDQLVNADRIVNSWGKNYEYVGVKCKFRTEFLTDHNQGKYGIRIEFLVKNTQFESDEPDYVARADVPKEKKERFNIMVKELSLESFSGNPYCYPVNTEQVAYFKVNKGVIYGLNRVCLFQNSTDTDLTDEQIASGDMTVDFMPEYDSAGNLVYNPEREVLDRNNVFATDIDIRFYEKKNLLDSMFLVHITAERGTHVYNAKVHKDNTGKIITDHPGIPSVILKAHLFYGGKDILDEDSYEVHWYRECPDYQSAAYEGSTKDVHNNYVANYMDAGWAPIFRPKDLPTTEIGYGMFVNEFAPMEVNQYAQPVLKDAKKVGPEQWPPVDPSDVLTVHEADKYERPSFRELIVPKDKVPWAWYYTCVIVQKPKAQVKDTSGNIVSKDVDIPQVYKYRPNQVGVQGIEIVRDDSLYDLALSDIIPITSSTSVASYLRILDYNDMDKTMAPPQPKTPWFGNWWYKADNRPIAAFDGNVRNLYGGNKEDSVVTKFVEQGKEEEDAVEIPIESTGTNDLKDEKNVNMNGLVEVTPYLLNENVDFVVAAIDPKMISDKGYSYVQQRIGTNREMCVGVLHKQVVSTDAETLKVSWEGTDHFTYNYDGNCKSWFSEEGFAITPVIHFLDNTFDQVTLKLYGPGGIDQGEEIHTLDYYDSQGLGVGEGYSPPNSMLRNIYIENLENNQFRVHFGVRQTYSETLAEPSKNSFTLVCESVRGDDVYSPFEKTITFSKDGEGANGTGWSVDIDACVTDKDQLDRYKYAYTRLEYLRPLLIEQTEEGTSPNKKYAWKQIMNESGTVPVSQLIIRPFIYRAGKGTGARPPFENGESYEIEKEGDDLIHDFFDFPAHLGYWAQTVWDVRFPSGTEDKDLRYNSYLRLYELGTNAPFTPTQWKNADVQRPMPRGFSWSDDGDALHKGYEGVCAITHSNDGHGGAIEIRLNPELADMNKGLQPPVDEKHSYEHFQFVVTAATYIYRGCHEQIGDKWVINPNAEAREQVTVIYSYYPVDLLVVNDVVGFAKYAYDPRKLQCNWPRSVLYSGTGIQPIYSEDKNGLVFFYGTMEQKTADGSKIGTVFAKNYAHHDLKWWPAYNLTPKVQAIDYENQGILERNELGKPSGQFQLPYIEVQDPPEYDINGNEKPRTTHYEKVLQTYIPNGAINPASPMFGLLATYWGDKNLDPFGGTARFYRNQVFIMSRYSNNGVNVWDGQGISIDTDNNTICAPTVAAGYKNAFTNDFTGVIMGIDKNQRKDGCYKAGITTDKLGIGNKNFDLNDEAYDNRQYDYSGDFEEYNSKNNPWMAGVYGYQQGIVSFGLMENGTAFFGRKDGGAQIVIDGSNGTIYGGGNGFMESPSVTTPMWNCMRITLTDLTRNAYKERTVPESWDKIRKFIEAGETDFSVVKEELVGEEQAEDKTHAMTSVNVYGGSPDSTQPICPDPDEIHNPNRLDFYDSFSEIATPEEELDSARNKMPAWYKEVWQTATVKLNTSKLPYFLSDTPNKKGGYMRYSDLPSWEQKVWKGDILGLDLTADEIGDREWQVNYWDNALLVYNNTDMVNIPKGASEEEVEKLKKKALKEKFQRSTFGYGRASTTPAIEVGEHIPGLLPGILPWCAWERVLKNFYIPGNRNFMVTYDGSMWAMNAIVVGNIIGSNIVGGRLQGAEIGIGCKKLKEPYAFQYIDSDCNWPPLFAPLYKWITDPLENGVRIEEGAEEVPAFYVDKFGNVSASSMRIFGGSIDIGTFHIRGKNPGDQAANNKSYGELIQYGMSDFIGVVHCYGNLGVGPNRNGQSGNSGGSNFGNFTQVKGQVAMGIAYSEGDGGVEVSVHDWLARQMGMEQKDYGVKRDHVARYLAGENAKVGSTGTIEQAAFFGIDAAPNIPENNSEKWQGHFWPMAFKYDASNKELNVPGERVCGWFTTMNLFKSKASFVPLKCDGTVDPKVGDGANYFRVSCFGTEYRLGLIPKKWFKEEEIEIPDYNNYYGHIGTTERNNGTNWAIGIQTWAGTPLILNSSCQTAVRSIGFVEIVSNCGQTEDRKNMKDSPTYVMPNKANPNGWYSNFRLGWYCAEAPGVTTSKNGKFRGHVWNGTVSLTAKQGDPDYAKGINNWGHFKDAQMDAGIFFSSEGTNAPDKEFWMWTMVDAMHIIQGNKNFADHSSTNNEMYLKDEKFGINAKQEFWIQANANPHEWTDGKPGLHINSAGDKVDIGTSQGYISMEKEKITMKESFAVPDNQYCIYARFG